MNKATCYIHTKYMKLQQEYSKLSEKKIQHDSENERIQIRIKKRLKETKDKFDEENKRIKSLEKMLMETQDKSNESKKCLQILEDEKQNKIHHSKSPSKLLSADNVLQFRLWQCSIIDPV